MNGGDDVEHTFERMSIRKRGHFPNTPRLFPVKKITISDSGIELLRKGEWHTYKWDEIKCAEIIREESFKSYGEGTATKYTKSTFILHAPDRDYKFDVSSDFPDFKNNRKLLGMLRRYLEITEGKRKKYNYLPSVLFVISLLLLWWWLSVKGY